MIATVIIYCEHMIIISPKIAQGKNGLTVAPSYVPCSDPACLTFGITRFFCLAFLRSWESTWKQWLKSDFCQLK